MKPIDNYLTQACIDDFQKTYNVFAVDCAFSMKSGEFNPMSGGFIQQIKYYFSSLVHDHGADAIKLAFTYKFVEESINSKYTILASVNSNITLATDSYTRESIQNIACSNMFLSAKNMTYADKNSFGSMGFFIAIASINSNFKLKLKSLFDYNFTSYAVDQGNLEENVNLLRQQLQDANLFIKEDFINLVLINSILLKTPEMRYPHRPSSNGLKSKNTVTISTLLPAFFICSKRKYLSILNSMLASPRLYDYELDGEDVNKCLISAGNELETFHSFMYDPTTKNFDMNVGSKAINIRVRANVDNCFEIIDTLEDMNGLDSFFLNKYNKTSMALIVLEELCNPSENNIVKALPEQDDLDNDAIGYFNERFSNYHEFLKEVHTANTEINKQYTFFTISKLISYTVNTDIIMDKGFSLIPKNLCSSLQDTFIFSEKEWVDIVLAYNNYLTKITMDIHKECIHEIFTSGKNVLTCFVENVYALTLLNCSNSYWLDDVYSNYLLTRGEEKVKSQYYPVTKLEDSYRSSGGHSSFFPAFYYLNESSMIDESKISVSNKLLPLLSDYLDNSINVLEDNSPYIFEFKQQLLTNFINNLYINNFNILFSFRNTYSLHREITVAEVSKRFENLTSSVDDILEVYSETTVGRYVYGDYLRAKKLINNVKVFLSESRDYFDYDNVTKYIENTRNNSTFVPSEIKLDEKMTWKTLESIAAEVTNNDIFKQENNNILVYYKLVQRLLNSLLNVIDKSVSIIENTPITSINIANLQMEQN